MSQAIQFNSVATNVLRDNDWEYNNATSLWERCTLLELAATNLVLQSDALATTWTAVGTPNAANAAQTAANRTFSKLTPATAFGTDYVKQSVTYTGDGVKAFSFLILSTGAAGTFAAQVYDTTAGASVCTVTVTIASNGTMTAACSTGTFLKARARAGNVYRVDCQTTSVTAAHSNEIRLGTAGTATSVLLSGVQTSDNLVPSSLIPTTTGTVTRNADVAYLDLAGTALAVPRESTWYLKWIELGTSLLSASPIGRIFTIGDSTTANTNSLSLIYASPGRYRALWWNGSTSQQASAVNAVALNDGVEALIYISPTGYVTLTQVVNGIAESPVVSSGTEALAAAFASTRVVFAGNTGAAVGLLGLQAFKAAVGNQSLATMRSLP
jgi:hypothetical protein